MENKESLIIKNKEKFKHTRNLYFCFKEEGTTLKFKVRGNIEEENKQKVYDLEKEGFEIVKVLCNE